MDAKDTAHPKNYNLIFEARKASFCGFSMGS